MSKRLFILPAFLVAAVLALVMTATPATAASRAARERHALGIVRAQLGDPYVYGAAGPNAFDCSGLTYYAFHRAGFRALPRTAAGQAGFVPHIRRSHMRPGDFVFFYGSGGVYHVAIFTGWHHRHRWIIHAPYPGKHVQRARIWTNAWFPGTLR